MVHEYGLEGTVLVDPMVTPLGIGLLQKDYNNEGDVKGQIWAFTNCCRGALWSGPVGAPWRCSVCSVNRHPGPGSNSAASFYDVVKGTTGNGGVNFLDWIEQWTGLHQEDIDVEIRTL